jgi:hypothetical protein
MKFDWFITLALIIGVVFAISALLTTTQLIGGKKCKKWQTYATWYGAQKPTYNCLEWE